MRTCNGDVIPAIESYLGGLAREPALAQAHLVGTGPVAELEAKLCAHYGMRHALCVSNATTGLLTLALAIGLRDAEFVTTPYTYGGSLAGWLLLGNRPRFADIDPHTLTLDAEAVQRSVTPATHALLAVDIYGMPCDMVALRRLADEHGLWYIADAAQSFGAMVDGRPASALADALVISMTIGKTLCAGEGGAILTDNDNLYDRLVWFSQHPARQKRDLGLHTWNELGLNGRIHPLAAVWANAALAPALVQQVEHQAWCFEVLRALEGTGLTQPLLPFLAGMCPSFTRLSAAWAGPATTARRGSGSNGPRGVRCPGAGATRFRAARLQGHVPGALPSAFGVPPGPRPGTPPLLPGAAAHRVRRGCNARDGDGRRWSRAVIDAGTMTLEQAPPVVSAGLGLEAGVLTPPAASWPGVPRWRGGQAFGRRRLLAAVPLGLAALLVPTAAALALGATPPAGRQAAGPQAALTSQVPGAPAVDLRGLRGRIVYGDAIAEAAEAFMALEVPRRDTQNERTARETQLLALLERLDAGPADILAALGCTGTIEARAWGMELLWRQRQAGQLAAYSLEPLDAARIDWALVHEIDPRLLAIARDIVGPTRALLDAARDLFFEAVPAAQRPTIDVADSIPNPGVLAKMCMTETGFINRDNPTAISRQRGFVSVGGSSAWREVNLDRAWFPSGHDDLRWLAATLERDSALPWMAHVRRIPGSERGDPQYNGSGGAIGPQLMPINARLIMTWYAEANARLGSPYPAANPFEPFMGLILCALFLAAEWFGRHPSVDQQLAIVRPGYRASADEATKLQALRKWNPTEQAELALAAGYSCAAWFGRT